MGNFSGQYNQGVGCIAIGSYSGRTGQGQFSIALGNTAGANQQGDNSIAIGFRAAQTGQSQNSIAIGYYAGSSGQGTGSIAIGYQAGETNQHPNSIILNADTGALNSQTGSAFYVSPIRSDTNPTGATGCLIYDTTTKEISCNTSKTFVIQHPEYESKYLVHACLEGPEAGVYYRGEGYCEKSTIIELPSYVGKIGSELTVQVSIIQDENKEEITNISCSKIIDGNRFKVFTSSPTSFNWLVIGKRQNIKVEVDKKDAELQGYGPYKWIKV